jgi:hypothetical protein
MKTTVRFDRAIQKLYTAFHNNQLHPECAMQCAVGNICDNKDSWKHLSDEHGSSKLNYVGLVHQRLGRTFGGYSPSEILKIEAAFLRGCGYQLPLQHNHFKPEDPTDSNLLFDGLCAAVGVLCELDGIKDIMDACALFDYQKPAMAKPNRLQSISI